MNDGLEPSVFGRVPVWSIIAVAFAISFTAPTNGQVIASRPELLSGPWEHATSSGVDGIFVMVDRGLTNGIMREAIQVRVYHRTDGDETWGWHVVSPPETADVAFDGRLLRIAGLNVTFDEQTSRWAGTWVLDGAARGVVLERPNRGGGDASSPLRGVWEERLDTSLPADSVRIQIAQSPDGMLTAWMDRRRVVVEQRFGSELFGRFMKVVSADPANVVLQNESPNYQVLGRFSGILSSDGNSMTGTWNGRPARHTFRRISR